MASFESIRNLLAYTFFILWIIIFLGSLFAFVKQAPRLIMLFSIISLFTIPIICGYAGLSTGCFFMLSDFCESVYGAIYENQFPIYGTSLGLMTSCYDSPTKTALYSQQYLLFNLRRTLTEKMAKSDISTDEYKALANISEDIKDVLNNDITYFTKCSHVYDNVVFAESNLCKNGMDQLKQIISLLCWLILVIGVTSYGIIRLKALVDKKSMEYEVNY